MAQLRDKFTDSSLVVYRPLQALFVPSPWHRGRPVEKLLQPFMQRCYERCKLVYESSLHIGEWELNPTPDADPAGLASRMIFALALPI
jgi:hypothetical protein